LPEFPVNLAGQNGDDAKPYQIKDVHQALAALARKQQGRSRE